jgi:hypothetical protein
MVGQRPRVGSKGATRHRVSAAVLATAVGVLAATTSACAVSDSDVRRWETTENGPEKLYAIVTHDKFSWALREEAALSLIHMRPRNGKRIGLEYLEQGYDTPLGKVPGALSVLTEGARKRIVDDLTPKLVDMMQQPPPPPPAEGIPLQPDPSIPYKDAAFGLLSHEPPLVSDDKAKGDLTAALTQWVQTDFESRVDNSNQQFGVEQIMRFLGAPSVKMLPATISEGSAKNDKATQLVADIGDYEARKRAGEALVVLAKLIDSPAWMDKQRALVNEANAKTHVPVTTQQVTDQLKQYQEQELEKVFVDMKRVGGRPVVEYCLAYAKDKSKSDKMRADALAAMENRMDKNVPGDFQTVFDILRDSSNPDSVRGVAMSRLGELPKEMIVSKLYSLFDDKKWQVRLDAAKLILRTITTKDVPDFMRHLPTDGRTKMGLSEPITYGTIIMAMDSKGGGKPRDVLNQFLASAELGPKLTAAGSYYSTKKSEASPVTALENDKSALPKCDPADNCGWECLFEKETKVPTTVGEFVRWCIEPSLQ